LFRNYVDHRYFRDHSNVVVEFWEITLFNTDTFSHRVGRVLSLFSSRWNWDSPNPSPAGECAPPPPPGSGVWDTFAGERKVGRVTNSDVGIYTVALFRYTYSVLFQVKRTMTTLQIRPSIFGLLSSLRIVDEGSAQDIADRLGGELRVPLVEGQLPTSATTKEKLIREEGRDQCECFYRLRKLPRGFKRHVVFLVQWEWGERDMLEMTEKGGGGVYQEMSSIMADQ
jgi:hypothetical protein